MPPVLWPLSRKIREAGWQQGSLLNESDYATVLRGAMDLVPFEPGDPVRLIVINQICDLVANPDIEPHVELVCGRFVDRPDPICMHGRNPRRIHLALSCGGNSTRWIDISIHDRVRVSKEAFGEIRPDRTSILSDEDIQLLRRWIAKRYTRPAFPDVFNERLATVEKRLEALWKSDAAHPVTGIYLQVPMAELSPEVTYKVCVRITAKSEAWEDGRQRTQLDKFEERLSDILDDCIGVELDNDDIQTIPEEHMTVADLRIFKRLDVDYRSSPVRPGVEGPPDQMESL